MIHHLNGHHYHNHQSTSSSTSSATTTGKEESLLYLFTLVWKMIECLHLHYVKISFNVPQNKSGLLKSCFLTLCIKTIHQTLVERNICYQLTTLVTTIKMICRLTLLNLFGNFTEAKAHRS